MEGRDDVFLSHGNFSLKLLPGKKLKFWTGSHRIQSCSYYSHDDAFMIPAFVVQELISHLGQKIMCHGVIHVIHTMSSHIPLSQHYFEILVIKPFSTLHARNETC